MLQSTPLRKRTRLQLDSYWSSLMAEIIQKRAQDPETSTRHVVSPTNPQHLAPTIAMKESPTTEELVAARFQKEKQIESSE